ncbi:MAG: HYR domain-containing protein, partial [Bacteroidia bacterium]|nr:HYR domain-containing protein [Bacteroidia bacterium]
MFLALILSVTTAFGQSTQTFSSSGTWIAPAGVTSVQVECWGGGGRGGSTVFSGNETGGGGGGAYVKKNSVPVNAGTSYTVTVGAGSSSSGVAGGDSWFNTNTTVMAKGGSTVNDNGTSGASGGSAASSIGDIKFSGGNGAAGSSGNYGGGGGSSAGTAAAGTTATNSNGGAAPTGGGNGGNGRSGSNGNGLPGSVPGGGGGGVRSGTLGLQTGGAGANGRVLVTWTCPVYALTGTSVSSVVCSGSAAIINLTGNASELPAGTYTISYNLSGANTASGITSSLNVTVAGSASFSTIALTNSGITDITITNLSSGSGSATCSNAISAFNTAVISVSAVSAGSISGAQTTCTGGDPATINNNILGTGSGTITYYWESSTSGPAAGFSLIPGANAESYDPPGGLSVTTWFRRVAVSTDGSTVCEAPSTAVAVTVSSTQLPVVTAQTASSAVCQGSTVNLIASTNANFSSTANPNLNIPDNNSTGVTSTINATGLPTSLSGWQVRVTVNIPHAWTSDLEIYLARPGGGFGGGSGSNQVGTIAGQSIRLSNDNGGSGDGYNNCTFRDDAASSVTTQSGNVTISGNFIPEELLSTLSGNPNGNWTLRVTDDAGGDVGTLTSWTLQIIYPNGLSFSWSSSPSGFTSSDQNPVSNAVTTSTDYTVIMTDALSGCTQSSLVSVGVIPNPSPKVIPGDTILCNGSNYFLHVIDTGAYAASYPVGTTVDWVNIISNQSPNDSLNTNGNGSSFQAKVTLPSGCFAFSPVRTVLSKAIVPNETITHASCNLSNGKIVANMVLGTAPFRYVWKAGLVVIRDTISFSALDSIYALASGSYTLEITDNYGLNLPSEPSCSGGPYVFAVNNVTPPSVSLNLTNISCAGQNDGSITANPVQGTSPYSFLWSNGAVSSAINGLTPGVYTVTVTDNDGCTATGQGTIIEPGLLNLLLTYAEPLCTGTSTGVVTVSVGGGTPPFTYEWFDQSLQPIGTNNDSLFNVPSGTYHVLVTDANACNTNTSILVEDPPLLTATCSAVDATCSGGSDGAGSVIAFGGRGSYSFLWSNGANTASLSSLSAGSYTVTVTDGNGCTVQCIATVSEPAPVGGIVIGNDVNCANDQTTVIVTGTGGTAPYSGEGSFVVGVGTHYFPITDVNGCSGTASITINNLDNLAPVISNCPSDITQCESIVTWNAPVASDNCTLISFSSNYTPGTAFPVGTTQVVYTATDNAGLISNCIFNVTILPTPVWYEDLDLDGFGNPVVSITSCNQPGGYIADNSDCDDTQFLYADGDLDGFGAGAPVACGVATSNDCNDNDAAVNPAAAEVCNGVDDDCDGTADDGLTFLDYYSDDDSDGFGDVLLGNFCQAPASSSLPNGDCDDLNAAVNPAAAEVCNGVDDDCDGTADDGQTFLDYYVDGDGDGFGDGVATSSCNPIAGSVTVNGDCDDLNATVNPAAAEVCNGVDDDCDGTADDGQTFLDYYVDGDGDGFGAGVATSSCNPIAGSVTVNGDCDDLNAAVNPAAAEVCNGVDDDCDGTADDGLTFLDYYVDGDGDGFGDGAATSSCNPIAGSVTVNGDCNDNNAAVNPAAAEVCNGVDDDCDGTADDGLTFLDYYSDDDSDGFGDVLLGNFCQAPASSSLQNGDCDDLNAAVNPTAAEVCNGVDDDCDGAIDEGLIFLDYYSDDDSDGFGDVLLGNFCQAPTSSSLQNGDCNDLNAAVNPAATEVCNGVDDDCDGAIDDGLTFLDYYSDDDSDGFGDVLLGNFCQAPASSSLQNGDCDDLNAGVNPAAAEVCNGMDDDCDGTADDGLTFVTYYADADGDGFGNNAVSQSTCNGAPAGYILNNSDCDDTQLLYADGDLDGFGAGAPVACGVVTSNDCNDNDAAVNPAAAEVCNGVDDDCDGTADDGLTFITYYADADGDGFGNNAVYQSTCNGAPAGYILDNTDCDDTQLLYADGDLDGFGAGAPVACGVTTSNDCNNNDAAVNPAATEVCNGVDDDCDGAIDDGLTFLDYYVDGDGDGFGAGVATSSCNPIAGSVTVNGDCDDLNAAVNPAATEVCNGVDDDCDGTADDGLTFITYYADADFDGFGNNAASQSTCNGAPAGYILDNTDCDDTQLLYADGDLDGFGAGAPVACGVVTSNDCNDNDAAVNPAAAEVCNGVDDDCDGTADDGLTFLDYYVDGDGDGFGAGVATSSCNPIAGSVTVNGDCDDLNAAVNPAAAEVCNGVDDDCDGTADDGLTFITYFADADGDGFGNNAVSQSTCNGAPAGYILDYSDCDDTQLLYADSDLDGFGAGAPVACGVVTSNDCNDNDAAVNPAAAEVCNGVDD